MCACAGTAAGAALPPVVSDQDLVMTRQTWGEARRDVSVEGKPLTIGGKVYASGIGTHAISMIPVDVPAAAAVLEGACGIDDEAKGGSVQFRVMDGSSVLWQSAVMKKGMPAEAFKVVLPAGASKLYLMAHWVENSDNDHADWIDLAWKEGRRAAGDAPVRISAADFGIKPGEGKGAGKALRAAISAARKAGGSRPVVIELPKGEYHFDREEALEMSFHVSNHDQPEIHPVGVPMVDLQNVTLKGNGSVFVFHGRMMPFLVMDSSGVKVEGIGIDYARPFYSEGRIVKNEGGSTELSLDRKLFPYEVKNGRFEAIYDDGSRSGIQTAMAFQKDTLHIAPDTSDISWNGRCEQLENGNVRMEWDTQARGLKPGDTLVLRNWGRPHPAMVIYRASDTVLNDVPFHCSQGMALLAQRCENVTIHGGGCVIRPGSERVYTASADATHFSNTKGLIKVEGALYEGMMDDAINVHSTCLSIKEIVSPNTIKCRYMHYQAVGFEVFLPGENLCFISGRTLENGSTAKVKSVRKLNTNELLVTLEGDLPAGVKAGDAVENADYYPSVVFKGNTIRNNRARGSLFTTPKKVVVENNLFDHSSGSAILLAGDAQGWYESGRCMDVVIRNNRFLHNLTSRYQFTEGIIAIYPEVKDLANQKEYYHHNVLIEGNEFVTQNVPLVFAISTKDLVFRDNKVTYDDKYRSWNTKPFILRRCADVLIEGNKVNRPAWTIDSCKLEMTPASAVTVKP